MNRLFTDIEPASLALAVVILLVAALLGYREWLDRCARPTDGSVDDEYHFHRRDRRRSLGLSILCVIALGIVIGSRTPIRVGPHANPLFLATWLAIFGLIFLLLGVTLIDWVDLRRYAAHKKNAIRREHQANLEKQIDQWQDSDDDDDILPNGQVR